MFSVLDFRIMIIFMIYSLGNMSTTTWASASIIAQSRTQTLSER